MNRLTLRLFNLCLIMLLCIPFAYSASISGVVYDYSLDIVENALVSVADEVDITENGEYHFELDMGEYVISAKQFDQYGNLVAHTNSTILIDKDKDYVLDLILFENLDDDLLDAPEFDDELYENGDENDAWLWILGIIVFGSLVFFMKRRVKKSKDGLNEVSDSGDDKVSEAVDITELGESTLKDEILKFIKENDGRTTQKAIRTKFPSSEAKISLVLTELEHEDVITKVKKGRTNVVLLKK